MSKLPQRGIVAVAGLVALGFLIGLLFRLPLRSAHARPFFSPPPAALTLCNEGRVTNYLTFDRDHDWRAFCVSNGTAKTLFYTVTEVEYKTSNGWYSAGSWLSNSLTNTLLMTRRETAGELMPGATDVFYATVGTSSVPWRLRLGCFESGWRDSLDASVAKMRATITGAPPPNVKSWSGRRYELISAEIDPGASH